MTQRRAQDARGGSPSSVPKPPGRPRALSDDLTDEIVYRVRAGERLASAAKVCGASGRSAYRWLRAADGANATELELRFARAVRRARAQFAREILLTIWACAFGQHTDRVALNAAMWVLARRFPRDWGRAREVETSDDVEHAASATVTTAADPRPRINVITAKPEPKPRRAAHPCPEELGADMASAGRRR